MSVSWEHLPELSDADLVWCRIRLDPLLIENIRTAACRIREHYHRRELPSVSDRFLTFGQIMHCQSRPIRRGYRKGSSYPTGVYADPKPLSLRWFGHRANEDLL
jgi:hypothetical protein